MTGRIGIVVLAALIPVAVLACDPGGWYWFGPVKWLVISAGFPVAAALLFATRPARIAIRPTIAAGALLVFMVLAAVFAVDPLYAWIGTPERHFGVVAWALCFVALVAGMAIRDRLDHAVLLGGFAIGGLGAGAAAAAEALGWEPAVFDVGGRLSATFGSPAYLGAAVALLAPVCVGCAADSKLPTWIRAIAGAAVVSLAVAAIGSGARAAWLGLSVAAAITLIAQRDRLRRRPHAVAMASGVAAVVMVLLALATPAGSRLAATFDRDAPGGQGRLDEWRVATRVLVDYPVLGVGPEGYRIAFAQGVDANYELAHGRDPLPDRAHSAPLDVALTGGLPALAAWLAFFGFTAIHMWRALRSSTPWLVGASAALVAHAVGSLVLFPVVEIEPFAWLLAGVTIAATVRPGDVRSALVARPLVIALGCVGVAAGGFGVLDVMADRRARDAVDALATGEPAAAYAHATNAVALRPDEIRLHLLAARLAVADERGTLAGIAHLERALERSPRDPVVLRERAALMVERARATLVPAHAAEARIEIDRLIAGDPHNAALRKLQSEAESLNGAG